MADSGAKEYEYREDYTTNRLPVWNELVLPLAGRPGLRFLEIGAYEGRSSVWFLENVLTAPDAALVCVDTFAWTEAQFDKNIARSGLSTKVTKRKQRSDEYLTSNPDERFDLIYVDGDHHAATVCFDGLLAWRLLAPRGLLVFDDYLWLIDDYPPHERPQAGIDVCLDVLSGQYDVLHKEYQVILRKR
jgi:predicted O-methyltransferase YrrM